MSMTDIGAIGGAILVLALIGIVFYRRAIKH
jgi:hypothetical protein